MIAHAIRPISLPWRSKSGVRGSAALVSLYTPWAFCRTAAVSTTIYCVLAKSSLCTQQMTVFPFNEVFAGRCQSRER
jgi:hypothetical protein